MLNIIRRQLLVNNIILVLKGNHHFFRNKFKYEKENNSITVFVPSHNKNKLSCFSEEFSITYFHLEKKLTLSNDICSLSKSRKLRLFLKNIFCEIVERELQNAILNFKIKEFSSINENLKSNNSGSKKSDDSSFVYGMPFYFSNDDSSRDDDRSNSSQSSYNDWSLFGIIRAIMPILINML